MPDSRLRLAARRFDVGSLAEKSGATQMSRWFFLALLACMAILAACSRTDPQAALDKAVDRLQTALEAKNTGDVLDMLHADFYAQQHGDNREWAKRTMTLIFLRYKNINIVALKKQNSLDAARPGYARTEAEVALTGAEGLIPDAARHYQVTMQWRQVDGKWMLHRLLWE